MADTTNNTSTANGTQQNCDQNRRDASRADVYMIGGAMGLDLKSREEVAFRSMQQQLDDLRAALDAVVVPGLPADLAQRAAQYRLRLQAISQTVDICHARQSLLDQWPSLDDEANTLYEDIQKLRMSKEE